MPQPYSNIKTTKLVYSAPSKKAAISFLNNQNITEPFYYIEVITVDGRFGIDNGGRVYDNEGRFIEPEPEPTKVVYDDETIKVVALLKTAMQEGHTEVPTQIRTKGEACLRSLRIIIEDESADFYLRRMALWWGSQFKDTSFDTFIKKLFIEGKDRIKLYQKAESSQSEIARAEEGLYIAAVDVLSGQWKPVPASNRQSESQPDDLEPLQTLQQKGNDSVSPKRYSLTKLPLVENEQSIEVKNICYSDGMVISQEDITNARINVTRNGDISMDIDWLVNKAPLIPEETDIVIAFIYNGSEYCCRAEVAFKRFGGGLDDSYIFAVKP